MTIDKRISYQWGGPGPGGQGARGQATQNPGSAGGGGDGRGRELAAQREAARQVAARQAERQAAAQREMQATIAAAEKQQAEIDKARTERAIQNIISGKEKQQAESERMSNLAEARKKMTQPVTINLPDARTIQPLGTLDPYQKNYVSPNRVITTGMYKSPTVPKAPMSPGEAQARGLGAQHHGSIRSSDLHAENVGGPDAPYPGGLGTVPGFGRVMAPPKDWYGGPDETKAPVRSRIQDDYKQFFGPKPQIEDKKWYENPLIQLGATAASSLFLPKPITSTIKNLFGGIKAATTTSDLLEDTGLTKTNVARDFMENLSSKFASTGKPREIFEPKGRDGRQIEKPTVQEAISVEQPTVQEAISKGEGLEAGKKLLGLSDEETNHIKKLFASRDRKFLQSIFDKGTTRIQSGKATQKEQDIYTLLQQYLVDPREGIMGVA